MQYSTQSPDDYIVSLPAESQAVINKLDAAIVKIMPKATRILWEGKFWGGSEQKIIGYSEMSYIGADKKEHKWFLIGLAQQKNYITVFVNAVENKQYLAEAHKSELGKAKVGKSSISFTKMEDINFEKLMDVIKHAYELCGDKQWLNLK